VLISDNDIEADSISVEYNDAFNLEKRVWVDELISGISLAVNEDTNTTDEESDDSEEDTRRITIPNSSDNSESLNYAADTEVQFIFKFQDSSDADICVDHDGDGVADSPLYALRLEDSSDATSFDLWSFQLEALTQQRGGVTILHNVINVNNKEKTVLEVDASESGNLRVTVLTLDGDIVKILERGHISAGLHYYYWDGTNKSGNSVTRGLYFIRITGAGIDETRKVMCVK